MVVPQKLKPPFVGGPTTEDLTVEQFGFRSRRPSTGLKRGCCHLLNRRSIWHSAFFVSVEDPFEVRRKLREFVDESTKPYLRDDALIALGRHT